MTQEIKHPACDDPTDLESKIWRYMDFSKYVSMLQNSSLFFTSIFVLGCEDPYEGSLPKGFGRAFDALLAQTHWSQLERDNIQSNKDFMLGVQKKLNAFYCVNCWHLNQCESAAMWKLYGTNKRVIAIQTTYNKLKNLMTQNNGFLGLVKYIDYEEENCVPAGDPVAGYNTLMPLFHKRQSFAHENEVRAIIQNLPPPHSAFDKHKKTEHGIYVPISLSNFIDKVYIDPSAEKWFCEVVQTISASYNLKNVSQSDLLKKHD